MSKLRKIYDKCALKYVKFSRILGTKLYMRNYVKYLQKRGAHIDNYSGDGYFAPTVMFDESDYKLLSVGAGTTIAADVILLTHDYSIRKALNAAGLNPDRKHYKILKPIYIGENVFIGARSVILPGTEIGSNAIIGAASLVRGKIPPGTIYGGYRQSRFVQLMNMRSVITN